MGCAMSLYDPSFFFLDGMATKSPVFPLITLRSRTTKQSLKVTVTYALSRSSSARKILVSVTSIMQIPPITQHANRKYHLPCRQNMTSDFVKTEETLSECCYDESANFQQTND